MAGSYEIPEEGTPNATADPKIKTMLKGLNEKLNSSNLLEDTGLASPNNSAYRIIFAAAGQAEAGTAAGTLILGMPTTGKPVASGANLAAQSVPFFTFAKADYEVANKTQKLRVRAQVGVNATKPTMKFTVGLYPITVAGGAGEFKITLGTVVSGSTVEFNEPAASTVASKESSELTIPSDGAYMFGVVTSAEVTASSFVKINAQLQTKSV